MIVLRELTKVFPGQASPAVDRLSLAVETGETCVLIGPSGCGKTTTMRMINRLIEPTSGTVEVRGRNVAAIDPVELRRGIGYVIQQTGLFPHMTIAENIATVPKLLGWDARTIRARVDEMLELVGLEPREHRDRYPRALSGGQRQRVGVARALAGDPPVMLMDEPFAAVDPITRARLQAEFVRIFRTLGKTIVLVTHDVDEAVRMGDRLAIMKEGRLVQTGTPDAVLARPANAFVEEFVGEDRAWKRLGLVPLARIVQAGSPPVDGRAAISRDASAREALAAMLESGTDALAVRDADGQIVGTVRLDDVRRLLLPAALG